MGLIDELAEARKRKLMKDQDFMIGPGPVEIEWSPELEAIDRARPPLPSPQITLSCKQCGSQQFRMILRGNKVIGLCVVSDCEGGVEVEFGI